MDTWHRCPRRWSAGLWWWWRQGLRLPWPGAVYTVTLSQQGPGNTAGQAGISTLYHKYGLWGIWEGFVKEFSEDFLGVFLEENVQNNLALAEAGLEANNFCCVQNFRLNKYLRIFCYQKQLCVIIQCGHYGYYEMKDLLVGFLRCFVILQCLQNV